MKHNIYFMIIVLFIFVAGSFNVHAEQGNDAPIVVELFTSQGCSSCPPADKIFSKLVKNENIIALGCHVSYWNSDDFKDVLSQDFCDMRQHGYIGMKGATRIYTPQMIINGGLGFIGSHQGEVDYDLKMARDNPIKLIFIEINDQNIISFSLPNIENGSYRLWAYGYKNHVKQNIGGGENSGRYIDYANPVMSYTNLGSWQGVSGNQVFDMPDTDIDGIAILAQEGGYGRIVAAGKLALIK